MDVLKAALEHLPIPVILALAVIVGAGWLFKEYSSFANYSQVMRNWAYRSFVVVVLPGSNWILLDNKDCFSSGASLLRNRALVFSSRNFSQDASGASPANRALTQTLLDDVSTARDHSADPTHTESILIKPLNRVIDPRRGPAEALKVAREQRALAIVWGWYTKSSGAVLLRLHFDIVPENLAKILRLDDPNKTESPEGLFRKQFSSIKQTFPIGDFDSFEFYFSTTASVEKISEFHRRICGIRF